MSIDAIQSDHSSPSNDRSGQLAEILNRCAGAYADNTLRGYASDLRAFEAWCSRRALIWLPAEPQTVAAFIDHQIDTLSASTLKRRLAAINFAHRMTDLSSPTTRSVVHLALRRAARRQSRRPNQAKGLTSEILTRILDSLPDTLPGLRDAALISVGYDTLCRSSELAMMTVAHLRLSGADTGSVLVPRSKGDQAADGRVAWLSPRTINHLQRWLEAAGIAEGPLFRSLHLARVSDEPLNTSSIRRLVKRAAKTASVATDVGKALSGHSMRVGAAQDMLVAGFDALAIMQAGGWKTTTVLLRYVEHASTKTVHERRWAALAV